MRRRYIKMASSVDNNCKLKCSRYVVAGGGIAGVTCAEQLSQLDPDSSITLISASRLIKAATNFKMVGRTLEDFDVTEAPSSHLTRACPNITVVHSTILAIDAEKHVVHLHNGETVGYSKLCVCTGATPKLIAKDHPRVLGIRDTDSVQYLREKLVGARKIVVVGNGGIAMEIVHEIRDCEVIWAIKDETIGTTFFDEGAARFFLRSAVVKGQSGRVEEDKPTVAAEGQGGRVDDKGEVVPLKRMQYVLDPTGATSLVIAQHEVSSPLLRYYVCGAGTGGGPKGSALGPDWSAQLELKAGSSHKSVHIEYKCEVQSIFSRSQTPVEDTLPPNAAEAEWPLHVQLTNDSVHGCDLVLSATGVLPCTDIVTQTYGQDSKYKELVAEGGGLLVDEEMRTAIPDLYAAGDACTVQWREQGPLWFQMRLWTQARQMGAYAAKCMVAHSQGTAVTMDFCFELFAHVTKFFGYKVVLLGKFNAQGLERDYELLLRYTEGMEYVKVVLQNGLMVGAVLIGDTDLEETFENLILNQMDLSRFGENLLNPDIDIEDYFD